MDFENLLKRLEEIISKLESGQVKLEEVNKLFAEGVEISKKLYTMVNDTKGKVTVLREEMAKFIEKPLD